MTKVKKWKHTAGTKKHSMSDRGNTETVFFGKREAAEEGIVLLKMMKNTPSRYFHEKIGSIRRRCREETSERREQVPVMNDSQVTFLFIRD